LKCDNGKGKIQNLNEMKKISFLVLVLSTVGIRLLGQDVIATKTGPPGYLAGIGNR
jgi:hypothetical protein